jgi:hypothetical protein
MDSAIASDANDTVKAIGWLKWNADQITAEPKDIT